MKPASSLVILVAEDDDDDFLLTEQALAESLVVNPLRRVRDGEELLDYLLHREDYAEAASSPRPGLVLLDLNMPRLNGREALEQIRAHPDLRHLPVVVLTTSKLDEDIVATYRLGVNSFIRKPVSFEGLVQAFRVLGQYWFEIVELPSGRR